MATTPLDLPRCLRGAHYMRRLLLIAFGVVAAVVVLPPVVCLAFPMTQYSLPAEGRAVPIRAGLDLNVVEAGAGPAILLVHGLPGTAYEWRATSAALAAQGYRAISYDRAGYGKSSRRPDGNNTLTDNVRDLTELITALELDAVWIVGWSYGGAMAIQKAVEGDPRVRGIVLVGSGGPDSADATPPDPVGAIRLLYSDPVLVWRSWVPAISRGLMAVLSDQAYSGKAQPDWWMPGLIANFSRPETIATYRNEMFASIDTTGFFPERIAIPVRILHGADDQLAPVTIGRYLSLIIPGAAYTEVEGGSHMLPVTMPGLVLEEVRALVPGGVPGA